MSVVKIFMHLLTLVGDIASSVDCTSSNITTDGRRPSTFLPRAFLNGLETIMAPSLAIPSPKTGKYIVSPFMLILVRFPLYV